MAREAGILTPDAIDRWWPYQVAVQAHLCTGKHDRAQRNFCRDLTLCSRVEFVTDGDGRAYRVFCFANPEDARQFREAFNGVPLYPEDRGVGSNRWKWNRPLGDVRRKFPLSYEA